MKRKRLIAYIQKRPAAVKALVYHLLIGHYLATAETEIKYNGATKNHKK